MILSAKFLSVTITAICGSVIFMFASTTSNAEMIYFNDADRGPSDVLQVGVVTASGAGARVATGSGHGLGLDAVGPSYEVNDYVHFSANQLYPDSIGKEWLHLSVDRSDYCITSLTFVPTFSIQGAAASLPQSFIFPVALDLGGGFGIHVYELDTSNLGPITLRWPDLGPLMYVSDLRLYMSTDTAFSENFWYYTYRQQDTADETIMMGVSVVSVEYQLVPEPTSLSLLALGGALMLLRRKAA